MVMTMAHSQHAFDPHLQSDTMDARDLNRTGIRTIKASEFKAKCLKLIDEVADSGAEYVTTKNGRPVSRLAPYRKKPTTLFGIDGRRNDRWG